MSNGKLVTERAALRQLCSQLSSAGAPSIDVRSLATLTPDEYYRSYFLKGRPLLVRTQSAYGRRPRDALGSSDRR